MRPFLCLILLFVVHIGFSQCPTIAQQPRAQSDCDGNSIRLLMEATATKIQWEKKRPTDANFSSISGATNTAYQIYPSGGATHPTGTIYRAKLTSGTCSIYSAEVGITLFNIQSITNPSICERGSGTLVANASPGAVNYQWTRSINGGPFMDLQDDSTFSGSQTDKLSIAQAALSLAGQRVKIRANYAISPNNDNAGSILNLDQVATCPRTSSEVILQIKNSPIPVHAATIYKGCIDQPIGINSVGCSPYTTQWYQGEKLIGTGARFNVIQQDLIPLVYRATCLKLGCESLPSLGTSAQAFPMPAAPTNAGTPTEICQDSMVTFRASGGTNNLWYASATIITTLSTASQYKEKASGTQMTRWVSQKINACESARTAISVAIRNCTPPGPTVNPPPADTSHLKPPAADTTGKTVNPPPADMSQVKPPAADTTGKTANPPPADTSHVNPPPPAAELSIHYLQLCGEGGVQITVGGCPSVPTYIENNTVIARGNSVFIPTMSDRNLYIHCEEAERDVEKHLAGLSKPPSRVVRNGGDYFCDGDMMRLRVDLLQGTHLIGWEKDGHIIAESHAFTMPAEKGVYTPVFEKNNCIYRGDEMAIDVHEKPKAPSIKLAKTGICIGDSVEIKTNEDLPFVAWAAYGNQEKQFWIIGKTAQKQTLQAKHSLDGTCWSDYSAHVILETFPIPMKPSITVEKDAGFCQGDSIRLRVNKTGINYSWNNTQQTQEIYVSNQSFYTAKWRDSLGCWSNPSDSLRTYFYPPERQPSILAIPNQQFCLGDSIYIQASPALRYQWNSGEKTDAITVRQGSQYQVKTQNVYGCWSTFSTPITTLPRENPYMPTLTKSSTYFIQARSIDSPDYYTWVWNDEKRPTTESRIKMHQSGLYRVQAIKEYTLMNHPKIACGSLWQEAMYGIPEQFDGMATYPNPNNGTTLYVEMLPDISTGELMLYNLKGVLIRSWKTEASDAPLPLQMTHIPQGSYLLKVISPLWTMEKLIYIIP